MEAEKKARVGPLFLFHTSEEQPGYQTFFDINERESFVTNTKDFLNTVVFETPQGWILVVGSDGKYCYLLDPINMVKKHLPSPPESIYLPDRKFPCILSASPTNPSFRILIADNVEMCLIFYQSEDEKWVSYKYDIDDKFGDKDQIMNIICLNGLFYGLTLDDRFAIINCPPHPEIKVLEPLPNLWPTGLSCDFTYIFESSGEIFVLLRYYLMSHSRRTAHISIIKRDFSTQLWDEVDDIGGRAVFLGYDQFAVSCSPSEPNIKANSVYFFEKDDKHFYCFDLSEGHIAIDTQFPDTKLKAFSRLWLTPAI